MRNITDLGSFAVKNDGSEDFKKFVLEPLNEIEKSKMLFPFKGDDVGGYYGIDKNEQCAAERECYSFETILSVQQVKDYLLSVVRPGEEKKQFEIIRISGVAVGVGFNKKTHNGIYSEKVCETMFNTGQDKEDAKDSEKWANIICDALNNFR